MLCREIIAVDSEIRAKHKNPGCGKNVEFLDSFQNCKKQLVVSSCLSIRLYFTFNNFSSQKLWRLWQTVEWWRKTDGRADGS